MEFSQNRSLSVPVVSIITPAYNAGLYISETILSVQNQTYDNWELIIVDDGSTDNTKEVIAGFLSDDRIIYIYQPNGRQGKARNNAIRVARGKYLAFLDADDLWLENKLQLQVDFIENNNTDLVYCQGWMFDTNNPEKLIDYNAPPGYANRNTFLMTLLKGNVIPVLSVLMKKEAVLKVNCFDEYLQVQNTEDYQLWLKLADKGNYFYGMPERLFKYRLHSGQSTSDTEYMVINKVWAISRINYESVEIETVNAILKKKTERALSYLYAIYPKSKLHKIINLYKDPLKLYFRYFVYKIALMLGRKVLGRTVYIFASFER